jgi:hypothetical protein
MGLQKTINLVRLQYRYVKTKCKKKLLPPTPIPRTHLDDTPGVLPGSQVLVANLHKLVAAHHSKRQVGVHLLNTKIGS